MSKAKNKVIAGDYIGAKVDTGFLGTFIGTVLVDNTNITSYELITDEHRKSAASGVARGLVGNALLGPVGMLAGGLSAKNKGIYTLAIQFNDGKTSLIEVDDKIYKAIIKNCFAYASVNNSYVSPPIVNNFRVENKQQMSTAPKELNSHNTCIVQNIIFVIDNYFDGILDIETVCDKMNEYTEDIDDVNDTKCHGKLSLKAFPISTEFIKLSSTSMENDADISKIWRLRNELAEMIGMSPRQQTKRPTDSTDNKPKTEKSENSPSKVKKNISDVLTDKEIAQIVVETVDDYFYGKTSLEDTDEAITEQYLVIADMSLKDKAKHEIFMEICDISIGLSNLVLGEDSSITTIKEHRNTLAKIIGLSETDINASASPTNTSSSAADEIRKFKELLDDGIITQEEFDAKKKQLLGL